MNYISFRALFIGIFFPAILYIFSIQILEEYFQNKRTNELQNAMIQNYEALYEGRYSIDEEIKNNIERYRKEDMLRNLGVITKIIVTTKRGKLLYPRYYEEGQIDLNGSKEWYTEGNDSFNYIKIAETNFQILNEGLILSVDVKVKHNSWLTNSILILYLFSSISILYWYYKRRVGELILVRENEQKRIDTLEKELAEHERSLDGVSKKEKEYIGRIEDLKHDREHLESDITRLKDEVELQKKKSLEVDEVLDEMERLEQEAHSNIALKEEKELEIIQLREEIAHLKKLEKQDARKRKKSIDSVEKRFSVLYKNVAFHKRAIEGYSLLTQDFQLKAEEIIHRLNEDDSLVDIRRKLFSKKGKLPIFEVIFSYSGRIYLNRRGDRKIEIVAVGTKNTQEQDIAFIEGMF